jgi:hypothetical protein
VTTLKGRGSDNVGSLLQLVSRVGQSEPIFSRLITPQLASFPCCQSSNKNPVSTSLLDTKAEESYRNNELCVGITSLCLKGQSQEIFDPRFFSPIKSPEVTDYHPKIFSNLVSILQKYCKSVSTLPYAA